VDLMDKQKKKEIRDLRIYNLKKTWYGKVVHFLWYEDSALSWIANIVVAFIVIKFMFYPLLALVFATELPVVAVVSCSMEHRFTNCGERRMMDNICGVPGSGTVDHEAFWQFCGDFYDERNITKEQFETFPLSSGFNKGDIIFLRGIPIEELKVGDTIVFSATKKAYPIIHRVIAIDYVDNEYIIQTKGDHNKAQISDAYLNELEVKEGQIFGKATLRVPFLGYIKIWFTDLINIFR